MQMPDLPSQEAPIRLQGQLLLADPSLREGTFHHSVILIADHSPEEGAYGIILNQPSGHQVGDFLKDKQFSSLARIAVHVGGPVAREHLTFAAMPDAQVVTGKIPRGHRPKLGPAFFVRQPGRSTAAFGVALDSSPLDAESGVRSVERLPLADPRRTAAWRVTTARGSYLVVINRTGKPLEIAGQEVADELLVRRLP